MLYEPVSNKVLSQTSENVRGALEAADFNLSLPAFWFSSEYKKKKKAAQFYTLFESNSLIFINDFFFY